MPESGSRESRRDIWRRALLERLASLQLSPERESEIVEEISGDLEERWRELVAGGASEDPAVQLALAELTRGNRLAQRMAPLRQSHTPTPPIPGASSGSVVADIWQDVRYSGRSFTRQPAFALAAVLTLAIGIGANSAIFSVVRSVLIESLPVRDADRLYRLRMIQPDGSAYTTLSAPDFMSVREMHRVFERVEAFTSGSVTMLGAAEPVEVRAVSVSDGLFTELGLRLGQGRLFERDEHGPGRNHVAILDHGFFQRAFGGDTSALGRQITIGGIRYGVVGVLAAGARLPPDVPGARVPSAADVYLPIEYGPTFSAASADGRNSNYLAVLAVARQGVTPEDVDRDLQRISGELRAAFPQTNDRMTMNAIQARELVVGDVRRPLLMLSFAVAFVLLVACANVANLMLTRASARQEELAVRTALGARRSRLLRQLLTEAVVLALAGGALGLGLAYVGTEALVAARPADIPRLDEIRLDWTVAAFAFAVSLAAGLGFGALPALQATSRFAGALRTGRRGGAHRRSHRLRAGLIVGEVALAVVLLAGAGLMLRTLAALTRVAPGFSTENAISFRTAFFGAGYDLKTVLGRVGEIESALLAMPGATAAAATSVLPLSGPGPRLSFSVIGAPPPPPNVNPEIGVASVTPGYLPAVGATLVTGRQFTVHDDSSQALVAIVNEAAVRRWFPDGNPIGKHVQMSGEREVVGVVADLQQGDPKQPPAPQLFVPFAQRPVRSLWFVVRSAVDAEILAPSIRATMRRANPNLAVSEVRVFARLQADAIARPRFYTTLLSLFAAAALVLSVIGVFGITSQTVVERTGEIGLRIALGARSSDVLRMIVGRAVLLALSGATIGIAAALAASRAMQSQLFGIDVLDLPTLGGVVVILVAAVAAASFLPALRAARLDPGATLRQG